MIPDLKRDWARTEAVPGSGCYARLLRMFVIFVMCSSPTGKKNALQWLSSYVQERTISDHSLECSGMHDRSPLYCCGYARSTRSNPVYNIMFSYNHAQYKPDISILYDTIVHKGTREVIFSVQSHTTKQQWIFLSHYATADDIENLPVAITHWAMLEHVHSL